MKPSIVFTKCSPYYVVGVPDCKDADGKPVAMQAVTALCRCGQSARRPYCDGAHSRIGFVGEKGRRGRVRSFAGRQITIHDNRRVCAKDGACVRELPGVFSRERTPWIDPDGASPEKIMATIEMCPSGALMYTYRGAYGPEPRRGPAIWIAKNGPYRLVGGIEITDDQGSVPQSREHCTLCRCGLARSKPFCDGAHDEAPFEG